MIGKKTTHDILDIDDRVIDHDADRYSKTTERHCVERDAEALQHDRRSEKLERDRGARNRGRPQVEQKKKQHHDDESGAQDEGFPHVARCRIDEIGWAK